MAIARTQAVANFSGSAGTTITRTITPVAGRCVAVCVAWTSQTATCSVADTLGNTYTAVAGSLATNTTNSFREQWFVAKNVTGGATTITATISGSVGERDIWAHEYSGVDTTTPVDSSVGTQGNSANPSTSLTTTAAGAIAAGGFAVTGTLSVGATYTNGVQQNGNASEDKVGTFTGAQTVAFVNASGSQWVISAIGLKEAAGGTTPVESSRRVVYDLIGSVSSTRVVKYDLIGSVSSSRRVVYDLVGSISSTRRVVYDMTGSVASTRRIVYDMAGLVSSQRLIVYDLVNGVEATRRVVYDMRTSVESSRVVKYDLVGSVSSTRRVTYDLVGSVASTRRIVYDLQDAGGGGAVVDNGLILRYVQ